jgi:oligopeptide transport system substrate-binding protein
MVKLKRISNLQSIATVFFALLLGSCSNDYQSNVTTGTRDQVLHYGNGGEPQDLDPHVTTGIPEYHIQMALLEGLVTKNPGDLSIEPAVAESWYIAEDGRTYTFNLRKNNQWSNGDPITAHDFIYAWKRALMPALGNQYAYMLFYIKGAEALYKGVQNDFSAKALDDYTLQLELKHPTKFFLQLLDHHSYYPVHQATIEKFGASDERGTHWTRPGNFVGNGPFKLKEWALNRMIVVEKNPNYWDAATVSLNEIRFYPIQNATTEERMFRARQLHITDTVPTEKISHYQKNIPDVIRLTPYLGTYYYLLNTSIPPLNDVRVRRAMAMSINREQIVKSITKGGQLPAYNLTPPQTNGYTAQAKIPYDIDAAKKLLAQAGYPDGNSFPTLNLSYNTSEGHRKIAIAIQQMWKSALNINIALENQDWKVFLDNQRTGNYHIARVGWIGDYLDPNTFLDMFVTDGGNNRTGWSNNNYDQLIKQAAETIDQSKRYEIFQQAEQILMNETPVIPIYTYTSAALVSKDVQGWQSNILNYHPYKYLRLAAANRPEKE